MRAEACSELCFCGAVLEIPIWRIKKFNVALNTESLRAGFHREFDQPFFLPQQYQTISIKSTIYFNHSGQNLKQSPSKPHILIFSATDGNSIITITCHHITTVNCSSSEPSLAAAAAASSRWFNKLGGTWQNTSGGQVSHHNKMRYITLNSLSAINNRSTFICIWISTFCNTQTNTVLS